MQIAVELYLRDQIIAGDFLVDEGRALDRFNSPREDNLIVHLPTTRSLHYQAPPLPFPSARVRKARILLAAPHDAPADAQRPRGGLWMPTREVGIEVGVGPFVIRGGLHLSLHAAVSLEELDSGPDQRAFIPITQASVRSLHQSGGSRDYPTVFLLRSAIDYLCLLSERP